MRAGNDAADGVPVGRRCRTWLGTHFFGWESIDGCCL